MNILRYCILSMLGITGFAYSQSVANDEPAANKPAISPSTLSFFVVSSTPEESFTKTESTIKTPGKLIHTLVKSGLRRPVLGLWATYGGMCTYSDFQGQITFPRLAITEEIPFVITQKIKPIILSGATVQFFTVAENAPCAYFIIRRKTVKDLFYWETETIPVPEKRIIPPFAVVLYAKPHDIIMNTDLITTNGSPNMLLPTIQVRSGTNLTINTLLFFKVNRYFAPVRTARRFADDRYATLVIPQ